jgi:hypothetical protein
MTKGCNAAHSPGELRSRLRVQVRQCHGQGSRTHKFHSITWSARARKVSGIVTPIAFAVLRLTASSNY